MRIFITLLFLYLVKNSYSQNAISRNPFIIPFCKKDHYKDIKRDEGFDVVVGANAGFYINGEFGFARSAWITLDREMFWHDADIFYRSSYSLTCEYNFRKETKVLSPKITFSYGGELFLHFGLSALYSTNLDLGTVYIRPFLGYSAGRIIGLSYGYNIPASKNHMKSLTNTHVFSLIIHVPFITREAKKRNN